MRFDRTLALAEVKATDADLLADQQTAQLVERGLDFIAEVTQKYGTPDAPRWASGSYETNVFMTYHNGGHDGHTSVGREAVGVARNVLRIAAAVNTAAGESVISPIIRAVAFYAACAHDVHQLCGRMLLPEGQGEGRGDERLSAGQARDRLLAAGVSSELARLAERGVLATAFNPTTGSQNLNYGDWDGALPVPDEVVVQELVAAADLLGLATEWGPLVGVQYGAESLGFAALDRCAGRRFSEQGLPTAGASTPVDFLAVVGSDELLRHQFMLFLQRNVVFLRDLLRFSDRGLWALGGAGIDELFPGRLATADCLEGFSRELEAGQLTPLQAWQASRDLSQSHQASASHFSG